MNFPSTLVEDAVHEFGKLPGIGQKSALRLVLHLLRQDKESVAHFADILARLKTEVKQCALCHNISDSELCAICASKKRDQRTICVVEDTRDVIAIENTNQYFGTYHVLGGLISPMEGVGPSDLTVDFLINRVKSNEVGEIILALSANMEGDTTLFYLHKKLKDFNIPITTIARGIAFGGELEYADEVTLGRSIIGRVPYENTLNR